MTVEDLLGQLEAVRSRGTGRWVARCPAHQDRTPSLSVREWERGLLIHCFAGCSLDAIVAALGLTVQDLFYARHADPATIREGQQRRVAERWRHEARRHIDGLTVDALREASALIESAQGLDISTWSHDRLHRELNRLADAYAVLEAEQEGI